MTDEEKKSIETASALIDKQRKEIEEALGNTPIKSIRPIKKYVKENYVSKDKIREKIEEIKEWDKEIHQENSWLSPYLIELLEELLEEN